MTQANHNTTQSNVPENPIEHAHAIGLIDWLADAVFLASDLTNLCAHCLALEVAMQIERTLDDLHHSAEEDRDVN